MSNAIIVLNCGSSSIKFTEFEFGDGDAMALRVGGALEGLYGRARFWARDARGQIIAQREWDETAPPRHADGLQFLFAWLKENVGDAQVRAVGHRVVHGGTTFSGPVRVDPAILAELEKLAPLAPLHQPHNLLPIRAIAEQMPGLPQVACFDTAFHCTAPPVAQAFALPPSITNRGVRRYGFHGLSYEYIAEVLPRHDPQAAAGRTVVMHLGNGASLCALQDRRSVATTMGFTAVDGLPMGTRCGSIDPGVILYMIKELQLTPEAIETVIYSESGLKGVSGISSDMRELLESTDPGAKLAIDLFVYRIGRELGSLVAALGGLDAIVFSAGIGERSPAIRAAVCRQAAWIGVELDSEANERGATLISTPGSPVRVWVIPTNEELMIARHTRALIH